MFRTALRTGLEDSLWAGTGGGSLRKKPKKVGTSWGEGQVPGHAGGPVGKRQQLTIPAERRMFIDRGVSQCTGYPSVAPFPPTHGQSAHSGDSTGRETRAGTGLEPSPGVDFQGWRLSAGSFLPRGCPETESRAAGGGQITSACRSPSTFFFCFSITASNSDTFSLSWRGGVEIRSQAPLLGCLPRPGDEHPAHLQQRALHGDLAVHAGPLLRAHSSQLLLLQ